MTLPNLLIVGVPKAGTSSLFAYLAQHPDICGASEKEVAYFSGHHDDGRSGPVQDYERFFAHCAGQPYAMEATPAYCCGGDRVRTAIRDTLGTPRLLLILREPVDRLWSAYTFQRSLGHLSRVPSFEAYVEACVAMRRAHPSIFDQHYLKGLSIGMYGDYVADWCEAFGSDLRVLFFDDLRLDAAGVVGETCAWLGIDHEVASSFRYDTRNATVHPRSVALAKAASVGREASQKLLSRAPGLRKRIRDTYFRLNAGRMKERLTPEGRALATGLYAASNRATALALRAHGLTRLPGWLSPTPAPGGAGDAPTHQRSSLS